MNKLGLFLIVFLVVAIGGVMLYFIDKKGKK